MSTLSLLLLASTQVVHSFTLLPSSSSSSIIGNGNRLLSTTSGKTVISSKSSSSSSLLRNQPSSSSTIILDDKDDATRQWDLFREHHAKGQWKGTWTSYDYMGDEIDSVIASVILKPPSSSDDSDNNSIIKHEHEIVTGVAHSDCNTCFDSTQSRVIPVSTYSMGDLKRQRLASVGMVVGPTLMKNGSMSTELILSHVNNSRLRVVFFHGPCWEKNVEPGSEPPMGLKLYRVLLSRETLNYYPTSDKYDTEEGTFFRPVPPFEWHAKWSGSSWTYGPQSGDRGWSILELEEMDAWHGRPTGDNDNVWAMRLPGGVLVQAPRIVYGGEVGLCRLAWMPEGKSSKSDSSMGKLLRLEAGVLALDPILNEEETQLIGFHPPALASLRCDTLQKIGELENASMLNRDANYNDELVKPEDEVSDDEDGKTGGGDSGLDAVRNALEKLM